jgi:hypothetical protein
MTLPENITYHDFLRPKTPHDRNAAEVRLKQYATELLVLSTFQFEDRELALRLVAAHSLLRGEYQVTQLALDEAIEVAATESRAMTERQEASALGGLDW